MKKGPKQPPKLLDKEKYPAWILKMMQHQLQSKQRYEKAHNEFAEIYNEFLLMIEDLNDRYRTHFTFIQAMEEFGGEEADVNDDDDR